MLIDADVPLIDASLVGGGCGRCVDRAEIEIQWFSGNFTKPNIH